MHDTNVTNGTTGGVAPAGAEEITAAPSSQRRSASKSQRERELLEFKELLTPVEIKQIDFVRSTFEPGALDKAVRLAQRWIGSNWIEYSTRRIRHVHGLDRLPKFDPSKSYLVLANHRSFFDLYVIAGYLVNRNMPHRLLFPVRSKFFYDKPLGLFVNGVMSFFAMYPPVFRERQRAALNLASLDETVRLLRRGGMFVGLHPEGTRNLGEDPYSLLPAQGGVGRVIQGARVDVLPVFINGLGNDLPKQILGNFTRKGSPVIVNFGAPVDFGTMLDEAPSPRLHRRISEHALEQIRILGEEEREIRANMR